VFASFLLLGALSLSITETILVFVCIPLAAIGLVFLLVYGTSAARSRRYRPGRPFEPTPVWYVAGNPESVAEADTQARALTAAEPASDGSEWPGMVHTGNIGGASDSW
jgi:hypothetical protein